MESRTETAERKLLALLAELEGTLHAEHFQFAMEETKAGEPGVALDAICSYLHDYGEGIPHHVYNQIEAIGLMMGLPECTWRVLQPLVERE